MFRFYVFIFLPARYPPCVLQKTPYESLKIARRLNTVLLAAAPERGLIDAEKIGCLL
jgi:hypothetical protein